MYLKKFLLVAAILALPAGAQTVTGVTLHQVNLYPYDTLITPLDTIALKQMYFTQAECPDATNQNVEMQGAVIKVTINQAPDACPPFTLMGQELPTLAGGVTLGRFPAGQYDLQVWLRKNDASMSMVAEKQLTVPPLTAPQDGFPRDNFSGVYNNDGLTSPSILTVAQSGYGLNASLMLYDKNNQPVWYILTPDLSGPSHPEIKDQAQQFYKNAWSRAQFPDALRPGQTISDSSISMNAQVYRFSLSPTQTIVGTGGAITVPATVHEFLGNARVSIADDGNHIVIYNLPLSQASPITGGTQMGFFKAQY